MDVPPSGWPLGQQRFLRQSFASSGSVTANTPVGFLLICARAELGFGQVRHLHPILTEGADAAARALRKVSGAQHQLCLPFADAVFYGVEAHHRGPRLAAQEKVRTGYYPACVSPFLRPGLLDLGGHGVVNFFRMLTSSARAMRPAFARFGKTCRAGAHVRAAPGLFCPSGPQKPCRPPHAPRAPVPFSVCFRRSRCSGGG